MTAAQKLLVNSFVARPAAARREVVADHKAMVIDLLLTGRRLMTVQASHALLCMRRHLVLVHNRVLKARVALGALARGTHKIRRWLLSFDSRPGMVDQKG